MFNSGKRIHTPDEGKAANGEVQASCIAIQLLLVNRLHLISVRFCRELKMLKGLMMEEINVDVDRIDDTMQKLFVNFEGPENSLYEGWVWEVKVELPSDYPYKPPSVVFVTPIYHPNIDDTCGAICVDALKEKWEPTYDLSLVFRDMLPQLLKNPNPEEPLNEEAGDLMMHDQSAYEKEVREHCAKYAKRKVAVAVPEEESKDEEVSEEEA
ncbi:hypothetical protein K2173_025229 [Erythroxylum novogranatense]|uniref:UBC core domain-containing protein n=1 Tax=Erythroxylum novogranatense TaxID=1862640 RepID=A0AAV8UGN2_9ROSI|nr:hypothetical protein K2173_025229 [Erythroxylum novogranatense]